MIQMSWTLSFVVQNLPIHQEYDLLFDNFKRNKFKLSSHTKYIKYVHRPPRFSCLSPCCMTL